MATKDEAFPSKYLRGADFEEESPIVTIKSVQLETMTSDRGTEQKYVAHFKELDKGLVLNRTNWDMIEHLTKKHDSDDWPGHKVMLVAEEVSFRGEIKLSVRVKRPLPQNGPRKVVTEDKGSFKLSTTVPQDVPFDDDLQDFK
jgi:hypothetical protein